MNLEEVELILGGNSSEKIRPDELSPLALAYIGDGVFEMMVRILVVADGNAPVNKLHKKSRDMVNAKAQSDMYFNIVDKLTDEELAIFKRGRNAKSFTTPKNASVMDYRHATGLEALWGYLYLTGNRERLFELFRLALEKEIS